MTATTLNLKFSAVRWGGKLGEQQNCLYISENLIQKLNLNSSAQLLFKIGCLTQQVRVCKLHNSGYHGEPILFVSPDIAANCEIPVNHPLTLRFEKQQGVLAIGPIIGLLTTRSTKTESGFGSQEPLLRALSESSAEMAGFAYIFCSEDIDWHLATVSGFFPCYSNDGSRAAWQSLVMPLPDIIYDRIPSRYFDAKTEVAETKNKLMNELKLPYFNPRFLDKWEVHLALQNDPDAIPYLPPTRLITSPSDILEFLDLYKSVFVKPTSGSLGKKILKIEKFPGNKFRLLYRSKEKQTIEKIAPDFPTLLKIMQPLMGNKNFIVQKNLNLAKYETGPFDIRVLVQKNMRGKWRRTKIYTRVAAQNSFLSNLSDGGQPKPISRVLYEVFGVDFAARTGLGEKIRSVANMLPPSLEKTTGETWGELGLDLGIDVNGKVWLIEINSKPFRALVSTKSSTKVIQRSLMRPLEYAKFLAGFYKHSFY